MANIVQVIKYEGDNNTFIWKHPREDFNLGSQLIVHESQEAVFFMNGQALDLFGPGRYTLSTQNIPLIGGAVKLVTDGETPFHCEVYFINKTEQMGIKWGTDSKVNYLDPNYNSYPFPVGASGQMSLRVADSRKLLLKLVGTVPTLSQTTLVSYFLAPMMMKIKSYLPSILVQRAIPIFDIDQHMTEFSEDLHKRLTEDFNDYGIEICRFWINVLVKPEDDPIYCKLKALRGEQMTGIQEATLQQQMDLIRQQTVAQKIVMESQAIAEKRRTEGYTYQQEQAYDVAARLAANEGIGNFSNAGIGLGLMGGVAGGFGATMAEITSTALDPIKHTDLSPSVPEDVPDMPAMLGLKPDAQSQAGEIPAPTASDSTSSSMEDFELRLKKLEMLKGKIPDSLYEAKMKEILDSI